MPKGGAKPGERRGGREKGTPNVATNERNQALAAIKASGTDPLTFFMDVLKSEDAPFDVRFAAAREAAPYMHPKLASVESRSGGKTHEERLAEYQRLMSDDPIEGGRLIQGDEGEGEGAPSTHPLSPKNGLFPTDQE